MITKEKVNIVNLDNARVEQRTMGNRKRTGESRSTNACDTAESRDTITFMKQKVKSKCIV